MKSLKGLKRWYTRTVFAALAIILLGGVMLESWLGWFLIFASLIMATAASIVFWLKYRCRRCDTSIPAKAHIFADDPDYCSGCGSKIDWE
ncbi:MAG: hypothetical protein FWE24_08040 [Defluviitaleaceae bacterium]|nr:hypothetical protein [Defluviitaleaceae bacterium]